MRTSAIIAIIILAAITQGTCAKVPLHHSEPLFQLAEGSWFADEQTLFVFYELSIAKGHSPLSQVEVRWTTDSGTEPWKPLSAIENVHPHVEASCSPGITHCGSVSPRVQLRPRDLELRFRYHPAGALTEDTIPALNLVDGGAGSPSRSAHIYGVFDSQNRFIQWRSRHNIPGLRNNQVTALGLRRWFRVTDFHIGDWPSALPNPANIAVGNNPYLYGSLPSCDSLATPWATESTVETTARASFLSDRLPDSVAAAPMVCGAAEVIDGKGLYTAAAIARKNPDVEAPLTELRTPIAQAIPLCSVLKSCAAPANSVHLAMQQQRLLCTNLTEICLENLAGLGDQTGLEQIFLSQASGSRTPGQDSLFTVIVHHDDATGVLQNSVEKALGQVLTLERDRTTPRVVGAFVFDSWPHRMTDDEALLSTLWCPAPTLGEDDLPDLSSDTCRVVPDLGIQLGPLSLRVLPILPTRDAYTTFLRTRSDSDTGRMTALNFLAPLRTPLSLNAYEADGSVSTFFNSDTIPLTAGQVLSYCPMANEGWPFVFRTASESTTRSLHSLAAATLETDEVVELGLRWPFPYFVRLTYQVTLSGAVTAFSASIPFRQSAANSTEAGIELWSRASFPLAPLLKRCTRFCAHPTFNATGAYEVRRLFTTSYRGDCYQPSFPNPAAPEEFPYDP